MVLTPKFVPWRPRLTLTGRSHYTVATISGQITSHTDTWDGLSDNSYLSVGQSLENVITDESQRRVLTAPRDVRMFGAACTPNVDAVAASLKSPPSCRRSV